MALFAGAAWCDGAMAAADLFAGGDGRYFAYRIPSMVATSRGSLLAFAEGRKDSLSDTGNIDTLLRRSTDGGRTWSPPRVIADHGADTIGNPCVVVDKRTGTILLLLNGSRGGLPMPVLKRGDAVKSVWITRSTDDGVTWSKPAEITDSIQGKSREQAWFVNGPGNGIQLRSGRLVIPVFYRLKGSETSYAAAMYSDDGGRTWKSGRPAAETTNECQVAELPDGSLLLNMRNRIGADRRAIAISRDGGETWSETALDPSLPAAGCQASLVRHGPETAVLLFSSPASSGRADMIVRASFDGGKTWPNQLLIHKGPAAYSSLAVLPDGSVACLYENGVNTAYEKITFARYPLARIAGGDLSGRQQ